MTVVDEFGQISTKTREHRGLSAGSTLSRIFRMLIAGLAASKDYRHLNGMTDQQLRRLGLTRSDIPKELHRRHFESHGVSPPGQDSARGRQTREPSRAEPGGSIARAG